MTQYFIILAQTVTGAVFTITGLLLVAGIIGYATAWYYAKSLYVPVIKCLQKENDDLTHQIENLNRQVEVMKGEIIKLNDTIDNQEEKIKTLEKQIAEKDKEIKKFIKPVKEN